MSLNQGNKANGVKGSLISSDLTILPGHYVYEEQVTFDRYQATVPQIVKKIKSSKQRK